MTTDARHLDLDRLHQYLDADVRAVVPISGIPDARLVVDPEHRRLSVRVAVDSDETVTPSAYRRIATRSVTAEGRRWAECSVEGLDVALEAYPVLCAVVDRIQNEGLPFDEAVADAVTSFRQVLQAVGRLTEQEEVGLIGELLVLRHLLSVRGDAALATWRGFGAEEHDFDLGDDDLEVKTTTSEHRRHWISTLTQLEPTPARPLWFLSLQVTRASSDSGDAFGLVDLIESIRKNLGGTPATATAMFEDAIRTLGWDDELEGLYTRRFRLRSRPAAYPVNEEFPTITAAALQRAGLRVSAFPRVTYQVDLTGVTASAVPPSDISGFCEGTDIGV